MDIEQRKQAPEIETMLGEYARRAAGAARKLRAFIATHGVASGLSEEYALLAAAAIDVRALEDLVALRGWGLDKHALGPHAAAVLRAALIPQCGTVRFLRELRAHWRFSGDDLRDHGLAQTAILESARSGRVEVLRELRNGWGLTLEDAAMCHPSAVEVARAEGEELALRELLIGWGAARTRRAAPRGRDCAEHVARAGGE